MCHLLSYIIRRRVYWGLSGIGGSIRSTPMWRGTAWGHAAVYGTRSMLASLRLYLRRNSVITRTISALPSTRAALQVKLGRLRRFLKWRWPSTVTRSWPKERNRPILGHYNTKAAFTDSSISFRVKWYRCIWASLTLRATTFSPVVHKCSTYY